MAVKKRMAAHHKCLEKVTVEMDCGGRKIYWIRCSHLKQEYKYLSCRISKQFKTFSVLDDGRIRPSSCPLDRGWLDR